MQAIGNDQGGPNRGVGLGQGGQRGVDGSPGRGRDELLGRQRDQLGPDGVPDARLVKSLLGFGPHGARGPRGDPDAGEAGAGQGFQVRQVLGRRGGRHKDTQRDFGQLDGRSRGDPPGLVQGDQLRRAGDDEEPLGRPGQDVAAQVKAAPGRALEAQLGPAPDQPGHGGSEQRLQLPAQPDPVRTVRRAGGQAGRAEAETEAEGQDGQNGTSILSFEHDRAGTPAAGANGSRGRFLLFKNGRPGRFPPDPGGRGGMAAGYSPRGSEEQTMLEESDRLVKGQSPYCTV